MTYQVITHNLIEGTHSWWGAPERVGYLAKEHRHIFHVRCWFDVTDPDREIEINETQTMIEEAFRQQYGKYPAKGACFGNMSCEDIARWCIEKFKCSACEVLEDGYGGAYARR